MTIAIAIQTLSAIVFAADSKLTTYGRAGYDDQGQPVVVPQTYDNATKVVMDGQGTGMAAVTGAATLGTISFMDYVASHNFPMIADPDAQLAELNSYATAVDTLRSQYWSDVPEQDWPDTDMLVATSAIAASAGATQRPCLWQMSFIGKKPPAVERITNPIYFAGSYRRVFSLIYGYDGRLLGAAAEKLKADGKGTVGGDFINAITRQLPILKPVEQILTQVMPIQDAMDFAYFLATVQIQMERWLPGDPLCGGPIDVMVLKTAPHPSILWHPGKTVHHPSAR